MSRRFAKQYSGQGVLTDHLGTILDWGAAPPTDGTAGYHPGALWFDTDAAVGSRWLRNDGSITSCDFNTLTGGVDLNLLTATAAEINGAADLSTNTVVVPAGGAAVVLPANGGTVMIPLVTANVTATLPATPTAGLTFTFIFFGTAADAEDWVLTAAAFFKGGVCWLDEDSAGVEVASIYANGSSHTTFTMNNPAAGTRIDVIGDGTNWCITGMAVSADTPAFS